ncbi:ribosomal protein S16 (BS17) [[Clostridium] ultunense Esp]|uniref:Small ribosomal subunit protein bS16 n=1 Tax=[Clostridium] ultunense Esp TaxID=1288971 RepID=M1Z3L0_9FIRM|nr:30S ribosomal protein S16 [Schnuerera ultunensis]CCQ97465.1 ribosomal protein S16 (BS17) [[Clostridium] ultunense Esp]SHD76990.1 ribosomal protein S16 (BS17) [[Clostridium] ultunense Esp]
MAVKIRLRRMGAKKNPFYRIVVADSRSPRDGRFIEEIGYYNPLTEPKTVKIDDEKATKWLKNGAKPTDTVDRLFKENGIYEKSKETNAEE